MADPAHRAELVEVVRQVRRRWRRKLAARGAASVIGGTLVTLLVSASGLEALRFSSRAIIGFRILILAVVAALLARWVVAPLRRRVHDGQVAMYLEECDPSLEAEILSAVEESAADSPSHSPALVDRLVALAVERCRTSEAARAVDRHAVRGHLWTIGSVLAAALLLLAFGPAYLRHGISALLVLSRSAEAASPYKIDVKPGSATIPRGSDQTVTARLLGFASPEATLMMRAGASTVFERVPLARTADAAAFEGMLFHVDKPVDYYVEAGGVRSPIFSMTLVDLPTVPRLELEYHYPSYTGLAPQRVESGGDVAALRGHEVRVRGLPTMPTAGG